MITIENTKKVAMFRMTDFLEQDGFVKVMTNNPPYVEFKRAFGGVESIMQRPNSKYLPEVPSYHLFRRGDSAAELHFHWDPNMANEWLLQVRCSDEQTAGKIKALFGV
jgi:hypothetical protein